MLDRSIFTRILKREIFLPTRRIASWWILISLVEYTPLKLFMKQYVYIKLPMSATFHLWNFNVFAYILIAHSRSVYEKYIFSSCIMCESSLEIPAGSLVGLSAAINRLNAVADDRGWWYAAFSLMLIRLMLITLRNDDFQQPGWF